jgi:hypothetical protein
VFGLCWLFFSSINASMHGLYLFQTAQHTLDLFQSRFQGIGDRLRGDMQRGVFLLGVCEGYTEYVIYGKLGLDDFLPIGFCFT